MELQFQAKLAARGKGRWATDEVLKVAAMVIYLRPSPQGHRYTCKHLAADGNCTNYADRPKMCSDFPYGPRCPYKACTLIPVTSQAEVFPEEEIKGEIA